MISYGPLFCNIFNIKITPKHSNVVLHLILLTSILILTNTWYTFYEYLETFLLGQVRGVVNFFFYIPFDIVNNYITNLSHPLSINYGKFLTFRYWWESLHWTEVPVSLVSSIGSSKVFHLILLWCLYILVQILVSVVIILFMRFIIDSKYVEIRIWYRDQKIEISDTQWKNFIPVLRQLLQHLRLLCQFIVTVSTKLYTILVWFEGSRKKSNNLTHKKDSIKFKFQFRHLNYYSMPNSILFIVMKRFNFINLMFIAISIIVWSLFNY